MEVVFLNHPVERLFINWLLIKKMSVYLTHNDKIEIIMKIFTRQWNHMRATITRVIYHGQKKKNKYITSELLLKDTFPWYTKVSDPLPFHLFPNQLISIPTPFNFFNKLLCFFTLTLSLINYIFKIILQPREFGLSV